MLELWQCPRKNHPEGPGNFVMFNIMQDGRRSFGRRNVELCKSQLESLLALQTNKNKITVLFEAVDPYIDACECYLGAAAHHGFTFLKFEDDANRKECKRTRIFTVDNYEEMCETLQSFNCLGLAEITIMDPDVE